MELQGISSYCGLINLAGLILVEYAPVSWIDSSDYDPIISTGWNWQKDISFETGGWLTLPLLPSGDIWEENQQTDPQGPYYEQRVQGIAPNLRPEVTGEFGRMDQYTFIIRLTDRNKQKWLLGDKDHGFRFNCKGSSGGSRSGLNNYSVELFTQVPHRAVGFEPVF